MKHQILRVWFVSNTHWVGDITYIKTYQGWSYLASVLNLASRQVVGWALSKHPNAKLAQDALLIKIMIKQIVGCFM
jgi:transposase InsO family protein